MKKLLTRLNHSYHLFYLLMVLITGIGVIFLIFPGESRFKYEFQKGTPWRHETLIAPFNFAILKTDAEIKAENDSLINTYIPYFKLDTLVGNTKVEEFSLSLSKFTDSHHQLKIKNSFNNLPQILTDLYQTGILQQSAETYEELEGKQDMLIVRGNKAIKTPIANLYSIKSAYKRLNDTIRAITDEAYADFIKAINLSDFIVENLYFDQALNQKEKKQLLDKVSTNKGMVQAGERIIFLAPGATIWREGQPASLTALRPVANGFFHEALVWLDAQGEAMRVEGFYPGLEALVVTVTETTITLAPVAAGETGAPGSARLTGPTTLPLAPGCRVGRGGTWLEPTTLQPGEQVYAVLNVDGQVKKIAAPG
jgi:hypothetical protein